MKGHKWYRPKWLRYWPLCAKCGLVRLRNDATEKAVRKGCDGDD